jgi:hydrogenase maturation protein HypF
MTADPFTGAHIWVRGIVQGVGFRPFIYSLARRCGLTGWVRNTSNGVEIEVNGSPLSIAGFISAIQAEKPPLARIDHLKSDSCPPNSYVAFEILASQVIAGQFMPISPDVSICSDCTRELFDPQNRRFRYPFINCTNCGPRFSIITDIPYDRPFTTMGGFKMCPECHSEYDQPLDRRFHAQPIACPTCGPQISFVVGKKTIQIEESALQAARKQLKIGKIIAIKGLGGYHLACDPTNAVAVNELRRRKKRSDKPFALMAFSLEEIEKYCLISPAEKEMLLSFPRPIVLLEQKPGVLLAKEIAPSQNNLGFMLAYTPLHLLLLEPADDALSILVMTSGNVSEEPIAYQDEEAFERLDSIADGYLIHNRPIHMRVDDSVGRIARGKPYLLRRSRGYAPDPIQLPYQTSPLLSTGGELKNTFCLSRDQYAFISHAIGDMENYETLRSFESGIQHYQNLFRIQPETIACDLHPNYLSTRYAVERASRENLRLVQVQHHHAHLAACLADNAWPTLDPVIGLTYDGTGYGPDQAIWGGEVLLGGYQGTHRLFHLSYTRLPGGDSAIRNPARIALAFLNQSGLEWEPGLAPVDTVCESARTTLRTMIDLHINSPLTSSMGRLFDAAAALIGIRQDATYEGQAAIEMESAADPEEQGSYSFSIQGSEFDPKPVWEGLLADLHNGIQAPVLSARFHNSVVRLNLQLCQLARENYGISTVALSGGVWQNLFLLERTVRILEQSGFIVLTHHQVPTNDGGIALGQAAVAAAPSL